MVEAPLPGATLMANLLLPEVTPSVPPTYQPLHRLESSAAQAGTALAMSGKKDAAAARRMKRGVMMAPGNRRGSKVERLNTGLARRADGGLLRRPAWRLRNLSRTAKAVH